MSDIFIWDGKGSMSIIAHYGHVHNTNDECLKNRNGEKCKEFNLPIHRTEAGYPNCATCDGGGCYDCTDPA